VVLGLSGIAANAALGIIAVLTLVAAAEVVVSKMEGVAKHYGVSEVIIAMTIVSIGTSLPELSLHIVGSAKILMRSGTLEIIGNNIIEMLLGSHTEIANSLVKTGQITASTAAESQQVYLQQSGTVLGASIGSDVVQETLVIGLVIISSALLAGKHSFKFSRKFLVRDYAPMMGTTFMTFLLALDWQGTIKFLQGGPFNVTGTLTRLDGLILVGSFVLYTYYLYTTRDEKLAEQGDAKPSQKPRIDLIIGLLAMGVVVGSAEIFLRVVELAVQQTGLSGSMIGVATVGIVSAFPEMITAISGLRHGSEGVSLGTLVGSNITNPLLAIGSGAVISTYAVPEPLILWDLPMETFLAGLPVVYMFIRSDIGNLLARLTHALGLNEATEKLQNTENRVLSIGGALILILLYFFYLYIRFTYFPHDFAK
jgi:cation:H+ antiporter